MTTGGRFEFRLSDSARDAYLAGKLDELKARNIGRAGGASELVKELLFAYFNGDLEGFTNTGGQSAQEMIDEREAEARRKLLGLSFRDLEAGE